MKRTLIATAVLVIAGSLFAATEKPQPVTTTGAPDSPLVAAARKSRRARKNRVVINNKSLKQSTGHLTTTTIVSNIKVKELDKSAEQILAESKAKEKERAALRQKAEAKAAAERQKLLARKAAAAEDEGPFIEDAGVMQQQLETEAKAAVETRPVTPVAPKPPEPRRP